MNKVLNNKKWNQNSVHVHVDPPPIPLIKSKNYEIKDKDCVEVKLCRYLASQNLDRIEFKTNSLTMAVRRSSCLLYEILA